MTSVAAGKWPVTKAGDCSATKLVGEALRERVSTVHHEVCDPGEEDPFFVADLGEVYRQQLRWKMKLARVKPFYGMLPVRVA